MTTRTVKPSDPRSEIAVFVREARTQLGISQEALAERYGRTKANVSGWEMGRHEPSFDILRDLHLTSGVPLPGVPTMTHPVVVALFKRVESGVSLETIEALLDAAHRVALDEAARHRATAVEKQARTESPV